MEALQRADLARMQGPAEAVPSWEPANLYQGVIRAWNVLGGEVDWYALEGVAELLGINDIELLIFGLEHIRDHQRRTAEAEQEARERDAASKH